MIIEYYSGLIYFNDFIEIYNQKSNDKDFNPNYNLLIDFRDAEVHLSEEDILELVNLNRKSKKLFNSTCVAYLTATPNQVVSSTFFKINNQEPPIKIEVFSTLESSLNWIGLLNKDKNLIQSYLDTLKAPHMMPKILLSNDLKY